MILFKVKQRLRSRGHKVKKEICEKMCRSLHRYDSDCKEVTIIGIDILRLAVNFYYCWINTGEQRTHTHANCVPS